MRSQRPYVNVCAVRPGGVSDVTLPCSSTAVVVATLPGAVTVVVRAPSYANVVVRDGDPAATPPTTIDATRRRCDDGTLVASAYVYVMRRSCCVTVATRP
jgi:hypothetical protein